MCRATETYSASTVAAQVVETGRAAGEASRAAVLVSPAASSPTTAIASVERAARWRPKKGIGRGSAARLSGTSTVCAEFVSRALTLRPLIWLARVLRFASRRSRDGSVPMPVTSRTFAIGVIALVVLAAGATLGWAARPQRRAVAPARATCTPTGGDTRVDGALLHVPPKARGPLPLVVAFHGAGGTGDGFAKESGLSLSADRHGFAVLYPTAGSSRHSWSLNRASHPDDVARLRSLLALAVPQACADPRRLYATGVSNGGGFAARVACEMAGTFAAVAPVAGGYRSLDACPHDVRTSVLEIHGSADQIVPYGGRGPDH